MKTSIESWRIIRPLGSGWHGPSWEAMGSGWRVKLKRLLGGDSGLLLRLRQVIEQMADLGNPFVAKYLHAWEEASSVYVVSEFAEGQSLEEMLLQGRGLEPKEALRHIEDLAKAAEALCNCGLVLGPLGPGSLILAPGGNLRLVDPCLGWLLEGGSRASDVAWLGRAFLAGVAWDEATGLDVQSREVEFLLRKAASGQIKSLGELASTARALGDGESIAKRAASSRVFARHGRGKRRGLDLASGLAPLVKDGIGGKGLLGAAAVLFVGLAGIGVLAGMRSADDDGAPRILAIGSSSRSDRPLRALRGGRFHFKGRSYVLGSSADYVFVGHWNCRAGWEAALFLPSARRIYYYAHWPRPGRSVSPYEWQNLEANPLEGFWAVRIGACWEVR